MKEEIKRKIKEILVERLNLDEEPGDIADDMQLFGEGLGLDSVDALEIIVALELEFGIKILPGQNERFKTVESIAEFVIELKGQYV